MIRKIEVYCYDDQTYLDIIQKLGEMFGSKFSLMKEYGITHVDHYHYEIKTK